jgi:hypothetical protein
MIGGGACLCAYAAVASTLRPGIMTDLKMNLTRKLNLWLIAFSR